MASPAIDAGLLLHPAALLAAAALSALVTLAAIAYGRRRLVDLPGHRRLHHVPTPRGGGMGIVVAVAACGFGVTLFRDPASPLVAAAFLVVAGIGWLDDHRPQSALLRFAVHLLAAGLVVVAVLPAPGAAATWAAAAFATLAVAWSINLHNFMDGIDGLLATQALFVLGVLSFALAFAGNAAPAHVGAAGVAATLAFLPFNAPRARIFMGDVGSGALGLLIGALALVAIVRGVLDLPQVLVLCSAFVIDASATLVSRFVRGRRWYASHREHLYQWLARRGHGHARVTAAYLGWNLGVALPALWLTRSPGPPGSVYSWAVAAAVYALGLGLWLAGKRKLGSRP